MPANSISAPIVSATHADEPPARALPSPAVSLPGAVPTQGSPLIEVHEAGDRLVAVEKQGRRAWAVGPVVAAIGHVGLIAILVLVRLELPTESVEGLPVEIVVEAAAPEGRPPAAAPPAEASVGETREDRSLPTQPPRVATIVPPVVPPPSAPEAPTVTGETSLAPTTEPPHAALASTTSATAAPPTPEAPLAGATEPPPLPPAEPPTPMPQPALVPLTPAVPPTGRPNAAAPPRPRATPVPPPPGLDASHRPSPVRPRPPVAGAAPPSLVVADLRAEHERQRRLDAARAEAAAAVEERAEARRAARREADGARAAARLASLEASPAPSAPSEDAAAEIAGYSQHVTARIAAMKHYPEEARARAAQGTAVVSFAVDAGGEVRSAAIGRSSGDAGLDAEAVATVRRVGSFGPPPRGAPHTFSVPLRYQMR